MDGNFHNFGVTHAATPFSTMLGEDYPGQDVLNIVFPPSILWDWEYDVAAGAAKGAVTGATVSAQDKITDKASSFVNSAIITLGIVTIAGIFIVKHF